MTKDAIRWAAGEGAANAKPNFDNIPGLQNVIIHEPVVKTRTKSE
jgi:hypothetical protein